VPSETRLDEKDAVRVLMLSKALVVGAYHAKLEALADLGVKLDLIIPHVWGRQQPEITSSPRYRVHLLPVALSGYNHLHFYRGLEAVATAVQPELFHVDEEHYSVVTFQAMRLARRHRIPALFFSWQNIWKRYPVPFRLIERYNFAVASAAIVGNSEAASVLRRKGFSKPIDLIPQFGVDPERFRRLDRNQLRRRFGIPPERRVIGYIGRLVAEKGLAVLIEALALLPADTLLLLIGGGPLRAALEQQAERLGLETRVRFIEPIASQAVPDWLNVFDCLVLPSLTRPNWKEQFGRVLIEAMACEVAVVGSDSGEIPNVIGSAGVIVPEGDAVTLGRAMGALLRDPDRRQILSRAGRERVLKQFTQRLVAEATLRLYRRLAA
jgi:glycosyltransferase involved in cell wall biosynthesis